MAAGLGPNPIVMRNVSHEFPGKTANSVVNVLDDITLSVERGKLLAIVGPSGCGKTTVLNILAGLEGSQSGEVEVFGRQPNPGTPDVGYLFARDALLPWRTVQRNAELALELNGVGKAKRSEIAGTYLKRVGLESFADSYPGELSHGMRQRLALVRTLAAEPRLILLDEPFSALDAQTKLLVQDVFSQLWQQLDSTVVLITHDLSEAIALADQVIVMTRRPGRVKATFDIDLPRPRSAVDLQADPRYHALYEEIWATLRDEVQAS